MKSIILLIDESVCFISPSDTVRILSLQKDRHTQNAKTMMRKDFAGSSSFVGFLAISGRYKQNK
jgi:hypothetical protein